jgi:hypothetical protein
MLCLLAGSLWSMHLTRKHFSSIFQDFALAAVHMQQLCLDRWGYFWLVCQDGDVAVLGGAAGVKTQLCSSVAESGTSSTATLQ